MMRLVRADKIMEVYYWEEDTKPEVTERLTGQVVVVDQGKPNAMEEYQHGQGVEVVLIAEGTEDSVREALLNKVWPARHNG